MKGLSETLGQHSTGCITERVVTGMNGEAEGCSLGILAGLFHCLDLGEVVGFVNSQAVQNSLDLGGGGRSDDHVNFALLLHQQCP